MSAMTTGAGPTTNHGEMRTGGNRTVARAHMATTPDDLTVQWQGAVREAVLAAASEFLDTRGAPALAGSRVDVAEEVLRTLLADVRCLRSTFLHAFALMQDDVMDGSPMRRGRPSAHQAFAQWHHGRRLSGSSARFGESAAILLGDLCLVWAEQMPRKCGRSEVTPVRAWPWYDAMRAELAVRQFADLANDTAVFPALEDVLDIPRRKSGNYTVRRPLEIGAALAGCADRTLSGLGDYGGALGEAFQLRDDLLGVFGSPETTGEPAGAGLAAHKATTVVAAAYQLASGPQRGQLRELMTTADLSAGDITRWQNLIAEIGTVDWIEELIQRCVTWALQRLESAPMSSEVRSALTTMAAACTARVA